MSKTPLFILIVAAILHFANHNKGIYECHEPCKTLGVCSDKN